MTAQTRLFPCLKDNYGVLVHDPATGATAAIDAPEAAPVEAALAAAAEAWHHYAGAPLELEIAPDAGAAVERIRLGADLAAGERPAGRRPRPRLAGRGGTLAGCTVAPGFVFLGFELAPPGWTPHRRDAADVKAD